MPVSPEHLSALNAYERLWRSDATDADIEAALAPGFTDHRPGAPGSARAEFAGHRQAALDALSGLSARYEPVAGDGQRLAAHATITGVHHSTARPAQQRAAGYQARPGPAALSDRPAR